MGALELDNPYDLLKEDDLGFMYSGSFHDGLTARLIDLAESVLVRNNVSRGLRNKLAFVMVEAYQNIIRHRVNDPLVTEQAAARSAFIVRSNKDVQSLVAINAVPNAVAEKISARIENINSYDKAALKKLFLEGLEENSISDKGGAGLGLIEMARRSGNPLGVKMLPLNERYSMFVLAVTIGDVNQDDIEQILERGIRFHQISIEEDMLVMHKGELSATAVSSLLPMVQRDMDNSPDKASIRSRAYLAGVEVFRSLKHSSDGIFALCRNGADYLIAVGQELPVALGENLTNSVHSVNAMNEEELNVSFRRALLSADPADKELRGLLDLAICSKDELAAYRQSDSGFTGLMAII